MLDIRHILKRYGTIHALSDVSLTVDRSEIVAVVGEDGAGKSTTLVRCIAAMVDLLNAGITPVIPEYGSLGAGGDLAPLADAALALLGEGDVVYEGSVRPAADALRAAALAPIELAEKEGSPSPTASLACSASPSLIPYASDAGRHDCGDDCRRTACHRRNVFC